MKGIFSGIGSILIAFIVGEKPPEITYMMCIRDRGKVGKPRTGKQHKETAERSAAPVPAQPQ